MVLIKKLKSCDPPKPDHSASLRLVQSSFGHSLEVLWLFKDFPIFCSVNLTVFNAYLFKYGIFPNDLEQIRFFCIEQV